MGPSYPLRTVDQASIQPLCFQKYFRGQEIYTLKLNARALGYHNDPTRLHGNLNDRQVAQGFLAVPWDA
jgi:hypothetical protein